MPHHDDRYPHRDHRPGPQAERGADGGPRSPQSQDRGGRQMGDGGRYGDRGPQGGGYGRGYDGPGGGRSGGRPGHDQDDQGSFGGQGSYSPQGGHDRRYDPGERDDGPGRHGQLHGALRAHGRWPAHRRHQHPQQRRNG